MKLTLATLCLLFSTTVFAGDIKCVLQEISDAKSNTVEMIINETEDPHGALTNFQTQVFEGYNGFVALSNGFIVIHLYNSNTNAAISTAGTGDGNKYARLQYLLPGSGMTEAIIIECAEQ